MKEVRAALRYAKALLQLAKDQGAAEAVNNDMMLIAETVAGSSDLQNMLSNPVINASEKTKVLNALFADKLNNVSKGLFNVLKENKRIVMLATVAKQYNVIYDFEKGSDVAVVTTAVALTDTLSNEIQNKIVALTGNKAIIENKIDESILGGFVLRIGDLQYDASVANQLSELRKEFDNSQYIPQI